MKIIYFLFALMCAVFCNGVFAQVVGDIVEAHLAIADAKGKKIYAKVPLPPGKWEVMYSQVYRGNNYTVPEFRNVQLVQIEQGLLKHFMEINMKVNGVNDVEWRHEPCKINPVLAKNDYGTSLQRQKCLMVRSLPFFEDRGALTQERLDNFAAHGIKHDYSSLELAYDRFGYAGYYLSVRQHFFPPHYLPQESMTARNGESLWDPAQFGLDPARKNLVDAILRYGEEVALSYDKAYMRGEAPPLPAFVAP